MIIGIDCSRAFVGEKTGTENYSHHLVKHILRLPASSQHSFVLFTRPNVAIPGWTRQKNVQIKRINFRFLWTQIGLAWATWQIPLNALWVPAHTLPVLRKPGLRTIVTIHGLEYQWLPEYKNLLQRWYLPLSTFYAAKYADTLIAVSAFTQQQLIKQLHTNSKKIKVIHEGVETGMRPKQLEVAKTLVKYGLQDKKYLLFVGTVQPRKNLGALIQAFAEFSKSYPDYQLVIAGGIGWMAAEILATPRYHGVQEKVIWTGRVSDSELTALYASALIYVQPSVTEGFGLPVLEAMQFGVPVIVSDGGALPEVVGAAGIVVPLNSQFVANLTVAIKELVSNKRQREKLVTMGHERVDYFGWKRAAQVTLSIMTG